MNKGVGPESAENLILSSDDYHVLVGSRIAENGNKTLETLPALFDVKGTVTLSRTKNIATPNVQKTWRRSPMP